MTECVFCDIVVWTAPATVVAAWPDALAFVPLKPVVAGHVLVIPRMHVEDFIEHPYVSGMVMRRAAELANELGGSMNLITSKGRDASQSVFHLHLHLVPRTKNDGLALPWHSGKGNHND